VKTIALEESSVTALKRKSASRFLSEIELIVNVLILS
jgi:hypothetical protein